MDQEAARQRAMSRLTAKTLELSPAGRAAFFAGEMSIDLGEGWLVTAVPSLNTFHIDYSPMRAYEAELAANAEAERQAAAEARRQAAMEIGARPIIPRDVQMFVWQRDGGRCVECGSNQNLEFDHILVLDGWIFDHAKHSALVRVMQSAQGCVHQLAARLA